MKYIKTEIKLFDSTKIVVENDLIIPIKFHLNIYSGASVTKLVLNKEQMRALRLAIADLIVEAGGA